MIPPPLARGACRRRLFIGQLAAAALVSGCGKAFEPDAQLLRRFERIKPGMSRSAVEQAMEVRPSAVSFSNVLGVELVRLSWQDGLCVLNVDFVAEHAVAKHRISRPL